MGCREGSNDGGELSLKILLAYNISMFGKDEIKRLEQKIDELTESVRKLLERQNSQYTDIMLQLRSGTVVTAEIEDQYEEAKEAVLEIGKASTSYLQRIFKIGYARAAHLMDMLEERGVVGPSEGSLPREVILKEEE